MKSLEHYLDLWSLHSCKFIEETGACAIYHVRDNDEQDYVLKILNDRGMLFESEAYHWYDFCDAKGAAKMYRYHDNAILLEYCDGGELLDLVNQGHDDDANEIVAGVVNELHANQNSKSWPQFKTMDAYYVCLFETDIDHPIIKPAQDMARYLFASTKDSDVRVLHADIHHKNIVKGDRGWLAIDPQMAIGDRHYEVANMFKNPTGYVECLNAERHERQADVFADKLALDKLRIFQFAFTHMALSASWHKLDNEDYTIPLQVGEMLLKRINA